MIEARPETSCSSNQFADSTRFIEILIGEIKARTGLTLAARTNAELFFSRFIAVVAQYFEVQVYDQFAIRGNAAIFKCQVPSFVADHVDVVGWIDSNGGSYVAAEQSYGSQKFKDTPYFFFFFLQIGRTQVPFEEDADP